MDSSASPVGSEDFYRTLVENAAEGMLTIDEESRIVYANPAVEEILGYEPEELIGESKMLIIPERLRDVYQNALAAYVRTGERHIDWDGLELPALHKDGHEVPTLVSLREHEHDGERYFTGIIRDITERREGEDELREQKERLDEFADILAHDIRNPLSVAQGYAEIAESDHDIPEIEHISEALVRIDKLVDDLLALSKEGELIGETERIDVADCVRESWGNVDTGDAELRIEGELGSVVADRSRLQGLFENLFRNSVEHGSTADRNAPRSEDAVEHGSTNDDVTVFVGRLPNGIYVADDGPGIPEQAREEVFERGYTTQDTGTGYGLSIVAQIADAHGWSIDAVEGERGGARFEIRFRDDV